jgi:hypothetical protein
VCEVTVADAPRELVWRTVPTRLYLDSTEWRISIEATDAGTRIVQRFTVLHLHPLLDRLFWLIMPAHRDRMAALEGDVQRIGEVAAATSRARHSA